jgi:hypothetical protein
MVPRNSSKLLFRKAVFHSLLFPFESSLEICEVICTSLKAGLSIAHFLSAESRVVSRCSKDQVSSLFSKTSCNDALKSITIEITHHKSHQSTRCFYPTCLFNPDPRSSSSDASQTPTAAPPRSNNAPSNSFTSRLMSLFEPQQHLSNKHTPPQL